MAERHLQRRTKPKSVPSDRTDTSKTQANGRVAGGPPPYALAIPALVLLASLVLYSVSHWFPLRSLQHLFSFRDETYLKGVRPNSVPVFTADEARRDAVVEAFKHAWLAYERDAMGDDEYHPISQKGTNLTEAGGIGYTVIDSIDTMLIMGLHDEYERARIWIQDKLSFDRNASFSTFETTIRVMGGLLSTYYLSGGDPLFLEKAREIADRMLPAFDTPSGLPLSMVNLHLMEGVPDRDTGDFVSTAEVSTLQLEFRYLAYLTDEDVYWDKVEKVMVVLKAATLPHGLAPIFVEYVWLRNCAFR